MTEDDDDDGPITEELPFLTCGGCAHHRPCATVALCTECMSRHGHSVEAMRVVHAARKWLTRLGATSGRYGLGVPYDLVDAVARFDVADQRGKA